MKHCVKLTLAAAMVSLSAGCATHAGTADLQAQIDSLKAPEDQVVIDSARAQAAASATQIDVNLTDHALELANFRIGKKFRGAMKKNH
jgi:outer membrane murein-binding lipoprotein Lpp